MWAAFEHELSGACDVMEVLHWARRHAEGRRYTIYAVVDDVPAGGGIVQIFGTDPTRAS